MLIIVTKCSYRSGFATADYAIAFTFLHKQTAVMLLYFDAGQTFIKHP